MKGERFIATASIALASFTACSEKTIPQNTCLTQGQMRVDLDANLNDWKRTAQNKWEAKKETQFQDPGSEVPYKVNFNGKGTTIINNLRITGKGSTLECTPKPIFIGPQSSSSA